MHLTTRRVAALVGALTLTLGVGACSKSEPTPGSATASASTTTAQAPKAAEILAKAKSNALGAKSGSFAGEVTENGQTMKIDFKGTDDGTTSDITIDMAAEGKVHLISVGGTVYMQGDAAFWKAQGAPAEMQSAGDKFIKAPAGEDDLTKELTISNFLAEAFNEVTPDKVSEKVGSEKLNGVDCWVLVDKKGKEEGSLYVSKDKFELVRFTGSTDSPGQIDFSSWNKDLGIEAPKADQIMDIS
ncbi:MAG TPA: hypothetical protein VFT81_05595 [Dermatophilaceae bacterium]|nr:hypothetical protein [Dermatophilaceae bacterium]